MLKKTLKEYFTPYIVECIVNPYDKGEDFLKIWRKCKSVNEFIDIVLNSKELSMTQGYAEISRISKDHWYRVRAIFGDSCIKTESDAGSIRVGNSEFSILIPTGGGDGVSRFGVIENVNFNHGMMNFSGIMIDSQKAYVYDYDCDGGVPIFELSGKYQVYYYDGIVCFAKL